MDHQSAFSRYRLTALRLSLVTAMVATGAWLFTADSGVQAFQKASNALNNFVARSPGERGGTDELKGKAAAAGLGNPMDPTNNQRALGKVFDNPAVEPTAPGLAPTPGVTNAPGNFAWTAPTDTPAPSSSSGGFNVFTPGAGGIGSGGGSTSGGSSSGGSSSGGSSSSGGETGSSGGTSTGGDTPGAVPEPSTWAMMILGFGLVGGSMRRRKTGPARLPARA